MQERRNTRVGGNAKNISSKAAGNHENNRLQLNVGEPWREQLSVQTESHSSIWKNRVTVLLAVCFAGVFVAMTAYAMATNDSQMLSRIMSIDGAGLVGIGIWATGKAALKVLSGWKDHHEES